MAMQPEAKKAWVEALRSGEYEQGACVLYNIRSGQYCALGVLAKAWADEVTVDEVYEYKELFPRLGLTEPQVGIVAGLNDIENRSFNEIADWIEESL